MVVGQGESMCKGTALGGSRMIEELKESSIVGV